ncbi:cytochrome P450 [Podospora fimiseda]|uniref:Cytochrome P450 n=1 Tax=Podospora fimiseda TaxID=252190 RepID=A0AAN6YPX1_9PEZI|nr:cytochrome P450 [Podospora fimiseda]
MEKDPLSTGAFRPQNGFYVLTRAPSKEHARQRKVLAYPFTKNALVQQEEIIRSHINNLVGKLSILGEKEAVNLCDWFDCLFLDIILDLMFGETPGYVDSKRGFDLRKGFEVSLRAGLFEGMVRRLIGPGYMWLESWLIPVWMKKARKELFEEGVGIMRRRLKKGVEGGGNGGKKKDFVHYILKGNEKGSEKLGRMEETEMMLNAKEVLSGAGSDTSATAASGIFHLILTHPACLEHLVVEIRDTFPTYDDITHSKLQSLPYLNACISESLRLLQPSAISLIRSVPPNGAVISGYFVPAGTTVAVHGWSASRSEANWKRASDFLPERWLGGEEWAEDKKAAAQHFSLGPRGCIGKNLALMELRLAVAALLWSFTFEDVNLEERGRWEKDGVLDSFMVWERNELLVKLTKL